VVIFLGHVLVNAKAGLSGRFSRKNAAVNIVLFIAGALIMTATIYMERA